jgi:hypothetical protein
MNGSSFSHSCFLPSILNKLPAVASLDKSQCQTFHTLSQSVIAQLLDKVEVVALQHFLFPFWVVVYDYRNST